MNELAKRIAAMYNHRHHEEFYRYIEVLKKRLLSKGYSESDINMMIRIIKHEV